MRLLGHLKLSMDRSFSSARLMQLVWLVILLFTLFGVFFLVNQCLETNYQIQQPSRIVELLIDPGTFASLPDDAATVNADGTEVVVDNRPRVFEFIITLIGAILFTGLMISIISNMVEARVEAFQAGLIRYKFSNHILILGASDMLAKMIREFAANPKYKDTHLVVLTNTNVEELQARLYSELTRKEMKNLVLLFGSRDSIEELKLVRAFYAKQIYIIGENNETEHDAVNIDCLNKIEQLCIHRKDTFKCIMIINNQTSYQVFQYQTKEDDVEWAKKMMNDMKKNNWALPKKERSDIFSELTGSLDGSIPAAPIHLTVINSLENWAQQVLVTRQYNDICYPAIDREGIGIDSPQRVHFVVVGMTQMALAMATTVAHISHYPNFRQGVESTKTKITFIAPNIRQEMDFFKGHHSALFKLSKSAYISWDENGVMNKPSYEYPHPDFGDFLDTEWEFIDGGIETAGVRRLLCDWCSNDEYKNDMLTIAICEKAPVANLAAALYLPDEIFSAQIPVFVYQPTSEKVVELANHTKRYQNIYPFGMLHDCYDPTFKERMERAKRINYLYTHTYDYLYMSKDEKELDKLWYDLTFSLKLSNIYAANSIPTKLRSLHLEEQIKGRKIISQKFTDEEVEILAHVEHNRWNMEKLLVGTRAMHPEMRKRLTKEEKKEQKVKYFTHADITPYENLSEGSKNYDRIISRNLFDVIEP